MAVRHLLNTLLEFWMMSRTMCVGEIVRAVVAHGMWVAALVISS